MKFLLVVLLFIFSAQSVPSADFLHSVALAHEKTFPSKQLNALTPEGVQLLTFNAKNIKPNSNKLAEFEKKYALTYTKGELSGNLYVGVGDDKKTQMIAVFLDGTSSRGETEFGATVDPQGKIVRVKVFSSGEAAQATSPLFLSTLYGKSAEELSLLRKSLEPSQAFMAELALKAIGRVESSFNKK